MTTREDLEPLLMELPHQEALRPEGGDVSFETAWEIRAFALAVAAHQSGQYDWSQFQQALIDSIQRWEQSGSGTPWRYYDRWLEALESLMTEAGVVATGEVDDRTRTVLDTPRDTGHHRAHHEPVAVDPARS
ncbi:MAG: nitrile hydratase b-subunit [Modestobacter sp.]|nr:nitrile hydratase b-subunit [Modestobacter sp.]